MPTAPDQPTPQARRRAARILAVLTDRYPTIETALRYDDHWQLLVATVLSAQTTDDTVNRVTPHIFARWPTPEDLANADPEEVEAVVRPTGFFRQKTRSIISLSGDLVERFGGVVPDDLERLVELRGAGRKTASVVLAEAFGVPAIAVDTHVKRVAARLELTHHRDPTKIERDLKALFPKKRWAGVSMRFIQFGRDICDAQRPLCWECPLARTCRWPGKRSRPA
jgi:endonuclease III